jgi:hypothetical protein
MWPHPRHIHFKPNVPAVSVSEKLVPTLNTTRRHNSEDHNLSACETLTSHLWRQRWGRISLRFRVCEWNSPEHDMRTSHLVRRPLLALLYQPRMVDECAAALVMRIGRGNRSTLRNPAPMTHCPLQIYGLTWYQTQAAEDYNELQVTTHFVIHFMTPWESKWCSTER